MAADRPLADRRDSNRKTEGKETVFTADHFRIGPGELKNRYRIRYADLHRVNEICQEAFLGCTGLQKVQLGALEKVGKYAFSGCSHLRQVTFPSSLNRLGTGVFADNRRLQAASFPRDSLLRELRSDTFRGCQSLSEICFPGRLKVIGSRAFYKCQNLERMELPLTLKTIEAEAFYACGLRELELPEGLLEIKEGAFRKCRSLEYVYLPDTLKKMGKWVFHGCSSLKVVEINHDLEEIGEWITNKNCTIRCPKGSRMEAYARGYGMNVEYI